MKIVIGIPAILICLVMVYFATSFVLSKMVSLGDTCLFSVALAICIAPIAMIVKFLSGD